jgi:hypothetical protein
MALALAEAAALTGVTVQVYVRLSCFCSPRSFKLYLRYGIYVFTLTLRYRTPGNWVIRAQTIRVLEPVACALACAADLLIAGVLIVLLGRGKSHFHQ